jgi:hypothetical protein
MTRPRSDITIKVVPLHSDAAGDAHVGGTAAERLAMVTELTLLGWELSGRDLPSFTRANMPMQVFRRGHEPR